MNNPVDIQPVSGSAPVDSPLPSSVLLEARDVHKTYSLDQRKLEVLRGITLSVGKGEFVALRGASGAGKSTLLHLLGGLDVPDTGEIYFDGKNIASLSSGELAHWRNYHIGFIFQAYHLFPELDALENVSLPARMARVPGATAIQRAEELLARVGLENRMAHRPAELSGGEQQRVAIARALINAPQLILADEPTGNLDSQTGEGIIALLCELWAEKAATLIIATHDTKVAERAARVLDLQDGKIKS